MRSSVTSEKMVWVNIPDCVALARDPPLPGVARCWPLVYVMFIVWVHLHIEMRQERKPWRHWNGGLLLLSVAITAAQPRSSLVHTCIAVTTLSALRFSSMAGNTIAFWADCHGNTTHLKRLTSYISCRSSLINSLVIGGDICPRSSPTRNVVDVNPSAPGRGIIDNDALQAHSNYLLDTFLPHVRTLPLHVFVMPGNTDFRAAWEHALQCNVHEHEHNVHLLGGFGDVLPPRSLSPTSPAALFLSPVPMCHHRKKDYELWDSRDIQVTLAREPDLSLTGVVSCDDCSVRPFTFDSQSRDFVNDDECIEGVLESAIARCKREHDCTPQLWFTHSPPARTCADRTARDGNAGSVAIRSLIEREQPYATFHGHIHETVRQSNGQFRDHINNGSTWIHSVGQDFKEDDCHFLLVDLNDVSKTQRIRLPPTADDEG